MNDERFSVRSHSLLMFAVAQVCSFAWSAESAAGEFFTLGSFSDSTRASYAWSIDDAGRTVSGSAASDLLAPFDEAFVWMKEFGLTSLGSAVTRVVSADGSTVAGWTRGPTADGIQFRTFTWTRAGGMRILPLPNGACGCESSFVSALSADGSIVIGNMFWQSEDRVFRWTEDEGYKFLDRFPEPRSRGFAAGASADGRVVAGIYYDEIRSGAFRWSNAEGFVDLGRLVLGAGDGGATDISADGAVIVGYSKSPQSLLNEPFRWTAETGMVGLGRLDSRTYDGYASATTRHGEAIVGEDLGRGGDAFLWTASRGMEFLQSALTQRFGMGSQLAGVRLTEARDISADGRAIVGTALNPSGEYEAYLIRLDRPIFAAVPEPTGVELIVGAIAVLLMSRPRDKRGAGARNLTPRTQATSARR